MLSQSGTAKPVTPAARPVVPKTDVPAKQILRKSGSGYTPSIKDALTNKLNANEPDAKEQLKLYSADISEDQPFTHIQFEEKWNEYVERFHDRPNLKVTLSKIPELNGSKLILKIENVVQNEEIAKIKPDLVGWLRKELKNNSVELITEIIAPQEGDQKPYSESERLAEMIKKNPEIGDLKKAFNLDIDDYGI